MSGHNSIIDSLFALEKVNDDHDQRWIVYTYVMPEKGQASMMIVIDVVKSESKAKKRATEIIKETGHGDILYYPLGKWFTLGDPNLEKVTPVEIRDNLKEFADSEEDKIDKIKEKKRGIDKEIEAEQKAITDETTLENYYFNWICAVQNKAARDNYKAMLEKAEEVYRMRITNLREKNKLYPDYKNKWANLLTTRLTKRGEAREAEAIISQAKEIASLEGLD